MYSIGKLAILTLLLTGCSITNNSTNPTNSNTIVERKNATSNLNTKASKLKKVLKNSKRKEEAKSLQTPIEVARVCFDKRGEAHNCNYKIAKPYQPKDEKPYN